MKKLLKSEICGSINSTRCALIGRKSEKSQTLQLLFIEQCMNSSHKSHKRVKKKKKKRKNVVADVSFQPNLNITLVCI